MNSPVIPDQPVWGDGVRLLRELAGLTQTELVGRLGGDPAITNRSISTWENGRGLDFGWLPELAEALDCSVTYLLGMTDDPQRWEPAAASETAPGSTGTSQDSDDPLEADATCNWILGPGPIPSDPPGSGRPPTDHPAPDRPGSDRDARPAATERESS